MVLSDKLKAPSHWNNPVTIAYEDVLAPGTVWMDATNFAPTETRSPDRPGHSKSL